MAKERQRTNGTDDNRKRRIIHRLVEEMEQTERTPIVDGKFMSRCDSRAKVSSQMKQRI